MTDWLMFPNMTATIAPRRALLQDSVALGRVRVWLWFMAAMVLAMVLIGGATRLTESGLSITEWKPVSGALPPMSSAQWIELFNKYKQIPQYAALFPDMTLSHFKYIYFWEWGHRLHARMVGLEMLVPLIWFWSRRQIPNTLGAKLLGIGCLIGLQGVLGWYMVASGLSKRVEVSQYLLSAHLLLASVTYAALIWQAVGLYPRIRQVGARRFAPLAATLMALVLLQIGLGALVAGLRAGQTFNTWPLMDGQWVPPLAALFTDHPLWRNVFENVVTVQFQHRMLAYFVLAVALWQAWSSRIIGGAVFHRALAIASLVAGQALVGIITLLLAVPLWAGLLHQSLALVLFGVCVYHTRALLQPAASAASRSAMISA